MSSVKDVRQQLAKMQREMEAKELELYRAQAQPLLDSFVDYLLNDKEICQKLKNYNKEEIRLIAAQFVKDFDRITAECADEIEAARQKRAERAAKRKAKETAAANVEQSPVQEGVQPQVGETVPVQTQETTTRPPLGKPFRMDQIIPGYYDDDDEDEEDDNA